MKLLKLWGQKFLEAWTACMVAMSQGDLTVLSIKHAIVASKTGAITGLAMVLTFAMCQRDEKWLNIWLTGALTMFADIIAHPTHFGEQWYEAAVTGLGAAMLAYLVETFVKEKYRAGT